jgi:hypothetical protein
VVAYVTAGTPSRTPHPWALTGVEGAGGPARVPAGRHREANADNVYQAVTANADSRAG